MKLSIIVPVFKVEKYIRPCMESIFQQGLDDEVFEVILVNDGTQDDSFTRIAGIIGSHNNISVLEQTNMGLSVARNTGLDRAKGDYILFLDSDDLLVSNSLPPILHDVCSQHPDILYAGFVKLSNEEIPSKHIENARYSSICQPASQMFVDYFNPRECYVWRALYKRVFLEKNNLRFIPGIYFEDVPFTVECYLKAGNCLKTDYILYIYRQRPGSIVYNIDRKKIVDFNKVIAELWNFRASMSLTPVQQSTLMDTIFAIFSVEIWHITHNSELLKERTTIINDLKQRVPELKFTNGLKQRFVNLFYHFAPSTYVYLKSL